jgi:hypothetical protein
VSVAVASDAGVVYVGTVAGGLEAAGHGFRFVGAVPGGGTLNLKLRTRDGVRFRVTAAAKGFSAGAATPPLATTTLRIGNDCFALATPCSANGSGTREVCKRPRR